MGLYGNIRKHERYANWRTHLFFAVVVLVFLVLALRLLQVQLIQREKFMALARGQYEITERLMPERGTIYDRCLRPLAMNIPTVSIGAYPEKIKDRQGTAQKLARLLGESAAYIEGKLATQSDFVYITRRKPRRVGLLVQALGLNGVVCFHEMSRQYPKGSVGCQLIGFTDVDGHGLNGVELSFERTLYGVAGKATRQKTAIGNYDLFTHAGYPVEPATDGSDVVLTIDYIYQNIAHKELHRTIREANADSGVVIIMDAKTSEVLALASEPSYNPNSPGKYAPSTWRLRAITDQFEPGSTLKLLGMAMLLNEGFNKPDDRVFCEDGRYNVMRETIHDVHPYGWLTLRDVLVYSSNIGMAKSVMKQDRRMLYQYARNFGFGNKTGIELTGEIGGTLPELSRWSGFTPLAMAYGHNIAVTPLQMANMFCAIANGGVLRTPFVVKEIRNKNNSVVYRTPPRAVRRVITESTADTLKEMMCQVVERGTGVRAKLPGIHVCGKTGTARMVRPRGGGYIRGQYIASFGGFFPKDKPRFVIFVMIDNPKTSYLGGDVAAPCFARIARQLVYTRGIDIEAEEGTDLDLELVQDDHRIVPNFIGHAKSVAKNLAYAMDLKLHISGDDGIVISQSPKAGTKVTISGKVALVCKKQDPSQGPRPIPDVVGLPIRNALNVLAAENIKAVVNGSGRVVTQKPLAGRRLRNSEQVMLYCESSVDLRKLLIF
ncbi:PASTA domain-containing protein [candidate division KSB1 bacterium]|nr:PASTA domain-containing protein [candidate division KSB1 bacterium]